MEQTIKYIPGTEVQKFGTITGLIFHDLFDFSYVLNDSQLLKQNEIKNLYLEDKKELINRLILIFERNPIMGFNFLKKMALKTQSIPKINKLHTYIKNIESIMSEVDCKVDWRRNKMKVKRELKAYWFTYIQEK